jgi:hypothetical protein
MPLQVEDIQGVILRGYGALNDACFLMLALEDPARAKGWLGGLELRSAGQRPTASDTCVNVAFTPRGLKKLGLRDETLGMLAGEFREGMSGTEHRRRSLGTMGRATPISGAGAGPGTTGSTSC